ncbi:radical SAM protein [Schaedlerella arabinosiphila]|jgi:organic radical activating enzyme|uniref:Radical SAM protein n=1 Tax=Schaedlerella arabinosiphila TaxID=2044587 RepID=A0A426DLV3_9FIRM|nr:radical SAM protein [Schaedlerella arabinosiphila]RRK33745.1 radical SAM protein [Schaedlerella arabinosiphila]
MDSAIKNDWGRLSFDWNEIEEIIVFGFGSMAQIYLDNITKNVKIRFIIDNSVQLKGCWYKDIPIYSYMESKENIKNTKIVIMAETTSYNEIFNILVRDGYIENTDFTGLERFICEWYFKRLRQVCLMEMHTTITTVCTFNCKKCNMFMPYYKQRRQYSYESLKENIDLIFRHVDYIFKYQLVGGEPFLNKDLPNFLEYLYDTYGSRIGRIRIITNGGVIPNEKLLYIIKKCNIEINISNYLNSIDYKEIYNQVIDAFKSAKINYKEISTLRWRDFGFPSNTFRRPQEEIRKHMLTCATAWHGLNNGCLYYCNSAWSASECGLFSLSNTDYIDLRSLMNSEDSGISIMEFCLGDRNPGYNSFCRICGGCGEDNTDIVQAGEQM